MRSVHGEGSCLAWKKRGRPDGVGAESARADRGEAHGARSGRGVAQCRRCVPHERRSQTRRRRRCDASIADTVPSAMDASRGAAALGFRPVGSFFEQPSFGFWSGNRTRKAEIRIQYSTIERSKKSTSGIEPAGVSQQLRCRPYQGPSSSRNTFSWIRHTPRQCRAHRAALGCRAAGSHSSDASHCRLSPTGNSCDRRERRRSEIGSASVRRPRRSTTTHADALTAARPWPRCGDWHRVLQGEAESGVEVAARECPRSCEC